MWLSSTVTVHATVDVPVHISLLLLDARVISAMQSVHTVNPQSAVLYVVETFSGALNQVTDEH